MRMFCKTMVAAMLVFLPIAASAQVHKCETARGISYQSEPCADPAEVREIKNRMTVIDAGPQSHVASESPSSAQSVSQKPRAGYIERSKPDEPASCSTLRRQQERADIPGRRPIRERMKKLGCSMFDW